MDDEEAGGGGADEVDEGGGVPPRVKKTIGQDKCNARQGGVQGRGRVYRCN